MRTTERARIHDHFNGAPTTRRPTSPLPRPPTRHRRYQGAHPAVRRPVRAAAALAGRGFLPLGLFARLPLAMLTLGTLTLATSVTGSYAVGGAAAGAVGIGSAVGAPILGWLADRLGQRPVLLISAVLNVVAVLAVIATAYLIPGVHDVGAAWGVIAAALAAGLSCPQVGPLARVRWMALTAKAGAPGTAPTWTPPCPMRARPTN